MFNIEEIGKRIRHEREKKGDSLEAFAEKIAVARQTLSKWEKGLTSPSLDDLEHMCSEFDCDFGYLVGEYNCKRRPATDIQKETLLSELACETLRTIQNMPHLYLFLDTLLSAPLPLLEKISKKYIEYDYAMNVVDPVTKKNEKDLEGKNIFADITINGDKMPMVPVQDLPDYTRFELMRAVLEFADRKEVNLNGKYKENRG